MSNGKLNLTGLYLTAQNIKNLTNLKKIVKYKIKM